jgi:hypothetical protein
MSNSVPLISGLNVLLGVEIVISSAILFGILQDAANYSNLNLLFPIIISVGGLITIVSLIGYFGAKSEKYYPVLSYFIILILETLAALGLLILIATENLIDFSQLCRNELNYSRIDFKSCGNNLLILGSLSAGIVLVAAVICTYHTWIGVRYIKNTALANAYTEALRYDSDAAHTPGPYSSYMFS